MHLEMILSILVVNICGIMHLPLFWLVRGDGVYLSIATIFINGSRVNIF